jgi:hypothetical protein
MTLPTQEPILQLRAHQTSIFNESTLSAKCYLIGAFRHAVRIVADVALGVVREASHARSLDGYSGGALNKNKNIVFI